LDEVENPSIFKTGRSHPNTPLPTPLAAVPYRASDLVPWHLADNPVAPAFVRYWSNSGHWPELALNGSVANDPKHTLGGPV
jgi:hypothetical protein